MQKTKGEDTEGIYRNILRKLYPFFSKLLFTQKGKLNLKNNDTILNILKKLTRKTWLKVHVSFMLFIRSWGIQMILCVSETIQTHAKLTKIKKCFSVSLLFIVSINQSILPFLFKLLSDNLLWYCWHFRWCINKFTLCI